MDFDAENAWMRALIHNPRELECDMTTNELIGLAGVVYRQADDLRDGLAIVGELVSIISKTEGAGRLTSRQSEQLGKFISSYVKAQQMLAAFHQYIDSARLSRETPFEG